MKSRRYDFIPSVPCHDADGNWRPGVDGYVEIDAQWQIASFNVTVQTEAETLLYLADRIVRWLGEQEVLLWMTVWSTGSRGDDGRLFTNIATSEGIADYAPDFRCFSADLRNARDRSTLERILLLMSALNWEGFVLSENATLMVWMGDEIIKLATNHTEAFEQAEAIGTDLGLQALHPDFCWGDSNA